MLESASYYHSLFILIALILTVQKFSIIKKQEGYAVLKKRDNIRTMQIFLLFFVFLYGFRPLVPGFGDTLNYVGAYERMHDFGVYSSEGDVKPGKDWIFNTLMFSCAQVMDVHFFFFIIMLLYIVPMYLGCKKLDSVHV